MGEAVKFSLIYSVLSIIALILFQILFKILSVEIFSYAIWLYIFYLVIGIALFFIFGLLTYRYKLSFNIRIVSYVLLCLLLLNSIPFFDERKILTVETIKRLFTNNYEFSNLGVHVIAIISFVITYLIYLKKHKIEEV
jgi:hypothetical protein